MTDFLDEIRQLDMVYDQALKKIGGIEDEISKLSQDIKKQLSKVDQESGDAIEGLFRSWSVTDSERTTIVKNIEKINSGEIVFDPQNDEALKAQKLLIQRKIVEYDGQLDSIIERVPEIVRVKTSQDIQKIDEMINQSNPQFQWGDSWNALQLLFDKIKEISDARLSLVNQISAIDGERRQQLLLKISTGIIQMLKDAAEFKMRINDDFEKRNGTLKKSLADCRKLLEEFLKNSKGYLIERMRISPYDVCNNSPISISKDELPQTLCIGEFRSNNLGSPIMKRLFDVDYYPSEIRLDVRNGGNIVIKPDQVEDLSVIDPVLSGLMMRYVESYPTCIRVDILDDMRGDWPRAAASTNMPITVHGDVSFLDGIMDTCDRISGAIRYPMADLYDLITKVGSLEQFQLIFIRSGFSKLNQRDVQRLRSLAERNGIISGVRMIIVDDTLADARDNPDVVRERSLLFSNFIRFEVNGRNIKYRESIARLSSINGDLRNGIQSKCSALYNLLTEYRSRAISYEEVGFGKEFRTCSNPAISILVGKSGTEIVSMDLYCINDGTTGELNNSYMIIGMPNTGKSSLLHSIILNGSMMYSPNDLNFWLLDGKSKSAIFEYADMKIPHIRVISEKNDAEDANAILEMALKEMDRRNSLFQSKDVNNLYSYNLKATDRERLPRILILVDEVQFIINDGRGEIEESKRLMSYIGKISKQSRFVGIHMILFAQDLEDARMSDLITNFIPQRCGRIAFKINHQQLHRAFCVDGFDTEGLQVGVACQWFSQGQMRLVKFTHSEDRKGYRERIAARYSKFPVQCLRVGIDEPLYYESQSHTGIPLESYYSKGFLCADDTRGSILGVDPYTGDVFKIDSERKLPVSMAILSTQKYQSMASSILASMVISSAVSGDEVHVCTPDDDILKHVIEDLNEKGCTVTEHSSIGGLTEAISSIFAQRAQGIVGNPVSIFINRMDEIITDMLQKTAVITDDYHVAVVESSNLFDNARASFRNMREGIGSRIERQQQDESKCIGIVLEQGRQPQIGMSLSFSISDAAIKRFEKFIVLTECQCYCGMVKIPVDCLTGAARTVRPSILSLENKGLHNYAIVNRDGCSRKFRPILHMRASGDEFNDVC